VSLASAKCRGFFVFGEERKGFTTEGAELPRIHRGSEGEERMKRFALVSLAVSMTAFVATGAGSQHTVSVTLNYDFSVDNACSASVTTGCVKQFNIYDITGGGTPVA
jgi:hypothetical protein